MLTRRLNHTCLGLVSGLLLLVGCETDVTNLGQRLGDGGAVGQAGAAAFAGSCAGSCGGSPGACGDGVLQVELGEECDDGNAVETDACTSDCRALLVVICGDGKLGAGEPCDDANVIDGDGCSADCTEVEEGYVCPVPGQPCVLSPVCGNGIIEGGEACDDGNAEDGDGCAGDCLSLE
jgi:cysteine-rich repeat protein